VYGLTANVVSAGNAGANLDQAVQFEGLAILPNGVTYYGNELSAKAGTAGDQASRGNWIIHADGGTNNAQFPPRQI
jgi:hypothetical protein